MELTRGAPSISRISRLLANVDAQAWAQRVAFLVDSQNLVADPVRPLGEIMSGATVRAEDLQHTARSDALHLFHDFEDPQCAGNAPIVHRRGDIQLLVPRCLAHE